MFESCYSLKILDFPNFNIKNAQNVEDAFDCGNLEYFNLKNFEENNNLTLDFMFDNLPDNVVICINKQKSPKISSLITNKYPKITISCESKSVKESEIFLESTEIVQQAIETVICENYYFLDKKGNYICLNDTKCQEEYPYVILSTKQCINNCSISDLIKKLCKLNYENKIDNKERNETGNKIEEELIENIREYLENGNIEISGIKNGTKIVIENQKSTLEIDNSNNQKDENKKKSNRSTIDLGECEYELKTRYAISQNEALIIFKLESKHKNSNVLKVEYEVYYKFENQSALTKLNLSYCENSKAELGLPVSSNINIDIINPESPYYKYICYINTSKAGIDITLSQRQKEYENNAVMETNCQFKDYNKDIEKIYVTCNIKTNFENKIGGYIPADKLFKGFIDIKNTFNIQVFKCIKLIFLLEAYVDNYANDILLVILILYFIVLNIFIFKEYNEIIIIRDYIIFFKLNSNKIKLILNKKKKQNTKNKKN